MPLMSVTRNFFLGNEPTKGAGPFKRFDLPRAAGIAHEEMKRIGIDIRDTDQAVGTLSGGERQTLAIARAEYFGARVLILDEPTSALGVKQSAFVLRHIIAARNRGLGVIFITHNVQHALPIGDTFTILSRGRISGNFVRGEIDAEQLHSEMGGGDELHELSRELAALRGAPSGRRRPRTEREGREPVDMTATIGDVARRGRGLDRDRQPGPGRARRRAVRRRANACSTRRERSATDRPASPAR